MKVPCRKCHNEMQYPYRTCKNCGWSPEGKFLEKAEAFARHYEKKYGMDPMDGKRDPNRSGPGVLKPPPGRIKKRQERIFDPDMIDCPKCGERIRIPSSERPIKLSCKKCRAKIKIID